MLKAAQMAGDWPQLLRWLDASSRLILENRGRRLTWQELSATLRTMAYLQLGQFNEAVCWFRIELDLAGDRRNAISFLQFVESLASISTDNS